ncbi:MAG: hypothetical protein NVSMB64_18510 [Candidatus Velthaea sp.]
MFPAPPLSANNLAPVAGVVSAGTTALIVQRQFVPFSSGSRAALWARIKLLCNSSVTGHGETDTPICVGTERVKIFKVQDAHSTGIYVRNVGSQQVRVSLTPNCTSPADCKPVQNVSVPAVKTDQDDANEYIYTANTLDRAFQFDWKLSSSS